jgi:hypothetical protein
MSDYPLPDPASVVGARVPFTFEAVVRERYGRKEVRKVYPALAVLQLKSIPSAELAYSIECAPGHAVDILDHQGQLFWPLNYVTPFRRVLNGSAFREMEDGTLDLFADGKYDKNAIDFEHDASITRVVWSGHEEALARVWRRANDCMMVAGELYGAGGVPIFVAGPAALNRGVHVSSSGARRDAEPRVDGLWTQPGGFHLPIVQQALARGHFCLAAEASSIAPAARYPRVVALRKVCADALELRIDATFRAFLPLLEAEGYFSEKKEKARASSGFGLTRARCDVLHHILAHGLPADEELHNLRRVLIEAAAAGLTVEHSEHQMRMKAAEDIALAALVGPIG